MEAGYINNRKIYLDVLRIVAILMVLFNHRACYRWGPNAGDPVGLITVLRLLIGMICKAGAPIFFVISGILLLNKQESFKFVIQHRIVRIIVVMLLLACCNLYKDPSFSGFYKFLVSGLNWYLYSYLLYLIMLSYLRELVKCSNDKKIIFMFIVGLFYAVAGQSIITKINPFYGIATNVPSIFYAVGTHGGWNIIYPISGYFVYELISVKNDKKSGMFFAVLGVLGGASIALSIFLYYQDLKMANAANYEMIRQNFIYFPTLFIEAIAVKFSFQSLKKEPRYGRGQRIIKFVSDLTFGIFLLETCTDINNLWKGLTAQVTGYLRLTYYDSAVFDVFFSFIIYAAIVSLIRLIPPMRKVL